MDEGDDRTALPVTDMEPAVSHAPLAKETLPRFNTQVDIRVISYRKAKHDPDGVSVKAVLDGIVGAGILGDDSQQQVKQITFESRKADKEGERTIIEISG